MILHEQACANIASSESSFNSRECCQEVRWSKGMNFDDCYFVNTKDEQEARKRAGAGKHVDAKTSRTQEAEKAAHASREQEQAGRGTLLEPLHRQTFRTSISWLRPKVRSSLRRFSRSMRKRVKSSRVKERLQEANKAAKSASKCILCTEASRDVLFFP